MDIKSIQFNRMELAGALGDLGTLLPIAIAMVVFNGLSPIGVFLSIGIFYLASGLYFGLTVPVQPMKVIGAYAIATAMEPAQIMASSLLMGLFLLLIGLTGAIDLIKKWTPKSVIRGVQFATGVLLIASGIKFILGESTLQQMQGAVEPSLMVQNILGLPISMVLGTLSIFLIFFFLKNKKFPAAIIVIVFGFFIGLLLGVRMDGGIDLGLSLPAIMPDFPTKIDFTFALIALVFPQLPMTLGNAVLAYVDLSKEYFGDRAHKITRRSVCISMACANFLSFILGGMPMCHGAGGLAAHYQFGARTAGSNIMIGLIFIAAALFLGVSIVQFFGLLPLSVLGALLLFAGAQLCLSLMDLTERKEFFVVSLMVGITLASNLAAGFVCGMVVAQILKWEKLSV